ncbi:tyrosine-type recombinase/integrase [Pelagerythrobacter aerophilus]|uniref:DUF4102 domain-containing protein n=1 Tax=Pelagerythrobacter aerophilus TaxID=2306995 RepID=A0A418NDH9_9SPHN|nr:integrase family protein [Pelagerythrobacter aerophilus]RIV75603.1 DUF4102 domain-containing protein [Pelagerythrobacter aerophilus]
MRITKREVDAAGARASGDIYYWDDKLSGFGLRVTPRGVKSYVVQYRLKGRPARRMTLGIHGSPWTPDKARARAEQILIEVKSGIDPVAMAKKKAQDARTLGFEAYAKRFSDECLKVEWEGSWEDAERCLTLHVVPRLKSRALPEIDAADIRAVIDPIRSQRALARKVWAVLNRLFTWAIEQHDLPANSNPMAGMKPPPKPADRKRVLSPDEIIAAWRASFEVGEPWGPFIRLLFATLQRRNEVAGLPWKELDQNRRLWHIHGERAKNGEDHLVPLNELALRELSERGWKRRGLVLTTTGKTPVSGFSRMKRRLDKLMLAKLQELADSRAEALGEEAQSVQLEPWRLHDIRRTGTTAMQSLGIPVEHSDACLNHKSGEAGTGAAKVYHLWKYEPEKRTAFEKWGAHLEQLVRGAEESNVVPLANRRA